MRLIEFEARNAVAEFPWRIRSLLTGAKSLRTLIQEAIWAAGREVGFRSAKEVAATFPGYFAETTSETETCVKTKTEDNQEVVIVFNGNSYPGGVLSEDDTQRWSRRLREYFVQKDPGREFACPYSEFAQICGEDPVWGQTIAERLQCEGRLTLVREEIQETGSFDAQGKAKLRRIKFWKFRIES